jgi:hypothetical protein
MKPVKKEELKDILFTIQSEDPYCGVEGEDEALSELIKYLEERGIKVE